jgi:hypothetical protein
MDSAARLKSGKLQGSLDLERKGLTSLRVFLGNHIFQLDLGSGGSSNNRSTSVSLKASFKEESDKLPWHTARWQKKSRDGS